jgi:glycosyltransferase involved in cell wall biosynthesis
VPNLLKVIGFDDFLLGGGRFAESFDVMHVGEQSFYSTWQIAKAKQTGNFKLIVIQAEINPFWYASKPSVSERAQYVRDHTDLFIARSQRAKAALICEGVEAERIRVVGHGVDMEAFHPGPPDQKLRDLFNIDRDQFVFLFVGHMLWTKGIFSIAQAAKLLLQNKSKCDRRPVFLMVGQGDELGSVQNLVNTLGLDDYFRFVGYQKYEMLPSIHRLADAFLLPSISTRTIQEQFGIAIIESMATGKPVISTHCGAIDEVVGDAGVLVQPNDYLRLYEACLTLMTDETLRRSLGERSLSRIQSHFSSKVVSEKVALAYKEVLGT